jgi:uncharacterized membrane protein
MKTARFIFACCLLLVSLMAFAAPGMAAAQNEGPADNITISPAYPTVEAIAGGEFDFSMELLNTGSTTRVFDLRITAPTGWDVYMTPQYEKTNKISSISLKPAYGTGTTVNLIATAPFWPLPDPGDYKIKIQAVSENVSGSAVVTARVTAKYILSMVPTLQLYNTNAESGKDNTFSMDIGNLGTATVDNIKFNTTKPDGWSITTKPEKVDKIEALNTQTVELDIKPPKNTIAGDYQISIRATGAQISSEEVQLRVTVNTPATWQWVGVGIIAVVILGLIVVFMRFSRR